LTTASVANRENPPLARLAAAARAYPRHLILGALVAGLLIGPHSVPTASVVAAVGLLAAGALRLHPAVAALITLALIGGAVAAHARLAALDTTALRPLIGNEVTRRATLLEAPRPTSTGGERALVRLAGGRGAGETVLARVPGTSAPSGQSSGGASAPDSAGSTTALGANAPGTTAPDATGSTQRTAPRRRSGWAGLEAGDEVVLGGTLQRLRSWDAWARTRGAHAVLRIRFVRATGQRRGGLAGAVDTIRRRAEAGLDGGLGPPEAALARGMVLGQDERLSTAARNDFQRSGLAHILAASGQNVMLLAALALPLLALAGLGLRARLAGVLLLVAVYVPLAGAGPSIQRAGVMGAAGLVAAIAGRRSSRWYALLLAAVVTLLLDPRAVGDPGWQLSFVAVIAILALAAPLRDRLLARGVPRGLAEAAALTCAATLGTAPLLAHHFDRVSPVSLPANVLATPAVAPAMWLGMLAAAAAQVAQPIAHLLDALALYPLAFLEWLARASASVPGAATSLHLASWWAVAAAYAIPIAAILLRRPLATAVRTALARSGVGGGAPASDGEGGASAGSGAVRRRRRPRFAGAVLAVAATLAAATLAGGRDIAATQPLTVSFLDIGQGDATLIQDRGRVVLVDAGPLDGPILARLKAADVTRIDLLVVTHDQSDHEGGAPGVIAGHRVGLVLDGAAGDRTAEHQALVRAAAAAHVRRIAPQKGQVLRAGRIRIDVLWPPWPPPDPGGDPNNRAIVSLVRVGQFDLFLPADAESDVTAPLSLPQVDVLKVAHHGSEDPGLPDLLSRLRPRVGVIEVGRHNPYGHPTPQTVRSVRASGAALYRTDRDGTVTLTVPGDRMSVGRRG
jgi:competence protein ComEC